MLHQLTPAGARVQARPFQAPFCRSSKFMRDACWLLPPLRP